MSSVVSSRQRMPVPQEEREYVVMMVAGQKLGIPVEQVEDVLRAREMTPVPLSPPEVVGVLNLRGRIVTAIDMRCRLGLPPHENIALCMNVVCHAGGQLYSFLVDHVSEVLSVPVADCERCPPNLGEGWLDVATGVYRLEESLLILLDVEKILLAYSKVEQA